MSGAESHAVEAEPPAPAVRRAVAVALEEDLLPLGDLTAVLLAPEAEGSAVFVSRAPGVLAGTSCAVETLRQVGGAQLDLALRDGARLEPGTVIGTVTGSFRSVVTAERTALNFLCHLSGVASLTARYVAAVEAVSPSCRVCDTRKTTPGLRALEKAAVRAGGGANHRGSLSEGVLVKDNHLGHASIADAVAAARRRWPGRMVEVECDRPEQVEAAVAAGATFVLCDNMAPETLAHCVRMVREHPRGRAGAVLVEASGGITLENVAAYAAAGPDVISVGALTHSAPALDIGLDLVE
ncbi:MAG TPA: carboxylating nicotinate-nucleotide diphosphorylase [Acidimicrobiales bacterium]|nr:carboxylating nicotinate-nucleotide diphosphorylase [Acidimicrobiales bacterium]